MNLKNIDLVCFSGLKRSGKDVSALMLEGILDKHKVPNKKVMLASKLKEFLMLSLPLKELSMEDMNGDNDFDREKDYLFPKNTLAIIIDEFLTRIDQYIKSNDLKTSFNPSKSRKVAREWLSSTTKVLQSIVVNKREFPMEYIAISIRRMLQIFGTDFARCDDDELWSKITYNEIKNQRMIKPNTKFILTDARMDVEIDYMKSMGLNTFVVELKRSSNNSIPNHITDMGLSRDRVDLIIHNDKDLEYLEQLINKLCGDLEWI